jgi:hypothetical protein
MVRNLLGLYPAFPWKIKEMPHTVSRKFPPRTKEAAQVSKAGLV